MKTLLTQPSWQEALRDIWQTPTMQALKVFLEQEMLEGKSILPSKRAV